MQECRANSAVLTLGMGLEESECTWENKRVCSVSKPQFKRLLPLLQMCLEYSSIKSEEKIAVSTLPNQKEVH